MDGLAATGESPDRGFLSAASTRTRYEPDAPSGVPAFKRDRETGRLRSGLLVIGDRS
jgi:hypothetical protein